MKVDQSYIHEHIIFENWSFYKNEKTWWVADSHMMNQPRSFCRPWLQTSWWPILYPTLSLNWISLPALPRNLGNYDIWVYKVFGSELFNLHDCNWKIHQVMPSWQGGLQIKLSWIWNIFIQLGTRFELWVMLMLGSKSTVELCSSLNCKDWHGNHCKALERWKSRLDVNNCIEKVSMLPEVSEFLSLDVNKSSTVQQHIPGGKDQRPKTLQIQKFEAWLEKESSWRSLWFFNELKTISRKQTRGSQMLEMRRQVFAWGMRIDQIVVSTILMFKRTCGRCRIWLESCMAENFYKTLFEFLDL